MCSGSWARGKSRAPASGKTGTRRSADKISAEQDGGEAAALRPGPGILDADRFEQLEQPLARRALVPLAVARDAVEQLVRCAVAVAARRQDAGKLVARLEIVRIRCDPRLERGRIARGRNLGERQRRAGAGDCGVLLRLFGQV